jgi:uncharacterized protein (DUF362 family)
MVAWAIATLGVDSRLDYSRDKASGVTPSGRDLPEWVLESRGFPGRVVHVRDTSATSWDFATGWYGDHVDQDAVDAMVSEGLMVLTGTTHVAGAWNTLIPDFQPGETMAIKVNFNNYQSDPPGNVIDAIIEPVNALIGGLTEFGFAASDISVYDVTHGWHDGGIPDRFINGCDYPGVNFVKYIDNPDPFSDTAMVHFDPPSGSGIPDLPIANVVVDADYLINMPIAKVHPYSGVTLGFKNHLGSIDQCYETHDRLNVNGIYYTRDYNPMVDIYLSPHIGAKTVLTLGDGIYGNWQSWSAPPTPWPYFGNDAPNSIFLSTDPVAIDCVMTCFLDQDGAVPGRGYDCFQYAANAGLGVYEKVTSPGEFDLIEYVYVEPPFITSADLPQISGGEDRLVMSISPNPMKTETRISLTLRDLAVKDVHVQIYDSRGRLVRTLADGRAVQGRLDTVWDGKDTNGAEVSGGVYWCSAEFSGMRETAKVILVR